jgi:hypothetical protein
MCGGLTTGNLASFCGDEVLHSGEQAVRIIAKEAEAGVAAPTEQAADLADLVMFMVNAEPLCLRCSYPTDSAAVVLQPQDAMVHPTFPSEP